MRSLAGLAAIFALLLAAPAAAQQPAAAAALSVPPLASTSRTLANGARLIALRDPGASNVAVHVWYGVGQRDDPVGRGGFAHLFEHLMFKQTRNLPKGVSAFVSDIGGAANATTLFDSTLYTTSAPANQLEAMLWMEGERLRNLVVDQANFDSERGVVKEEIRQRVFSNPYGRVLHLLLPAHNFAGHPYARPIGGTIAELDAAALADVRAFHETYYRPDNVIFVISGNFDPAQLDACADKYLGSIPRPSGAMPRDKGDPTPFEPAAVDAYAPNVPLPAVVFSWRAPPAADERAVAGMALIEAILTRGSSGLLDRRLVHEKALASDISHFYFLTRDGHAFALIATLAKGVEVAQGEATLAAAIAELRDRPVSEAELRAAKNGILGDALTSRETVSGRAYAAGEAADLNGDPAAADRRLAMIAAMTPADVQRIASEWLADSRRVTIRYRDETQRPQGFTPAPVADVAGLGTRLPPSSRPPVTIASTAERVAPPGPGAAPPRRLPELRERSLGNGLDLVVARSTELPLTTLQLVIAGGDSADPKGRAGLADMLAALLPRGTQNRTADQIAATVATLGGSIATDAQADATVVSLTVPSANADAAAALLAELVMRPAFAPDEVDKERSRQRDAIALASKQPVQLAFRALPAVVFAGTRYEAVPTAASLAAVTREEILVAHRSGWRPENATLIVTGSLGAEEGGALAQRHFGSWKGRASGTRSKPVAAASAYKRQVVAVDLPGAGQTAVLALLPAPGRSGVDYGALSLANAVLGGGMTGWLSQEIRVKRGLSYGAGSLLMLNRDAGAAIAVTRTNNESAPEVAELVLGELGRLQTHPLGAELIDNREAFLDMAVGNRTDTTAGLAGFLAGYAATGTPWDAALSEMRGFDGLTEQRIKAAARLFAPGQASLLLVGDSKVWIDELRARYPAAKLIEASALANENAGLAE